MSIRRALRRYAPALLAAVPFLPLCAGTAPPAATKKPVMRIYFIPFRAETYIPVTPETIDDGAEPILVTSPAVAEQIIALVQKQAGPGEAAATTDGSFNRNATRLLVQWNGGGQSPFLARIFVDQKGVALLGWHSYVLSHDSFKRLDSLLTNLRVKQDAEVAARQERARPALAKAADWSDLVAIRRLLAAGADPNVRDTEQEGRMTPLMHAAHSGNVPACDALLRRGAKIETKDKYGFTALTYAAMNQKRNTFDLLLRRGASVKGIPGERALLYAAGGGDRDMVLRLLKRGVNANCRNTDDEMENETPLIRAAVKGDVATARILIRHGARVDLQDEIGRTALTWAAIRGDDAMARMLLDGGAKVNSGLLYGGTPLTLAIRNSRVSMVRLLLERGATV
ncbi:MAG: ankyrin repeat domain-containing protein, partial [Fibrella sp.]|nr:ankyrin repeat domain-containing protein [Armatimonadota bacterium]